MDDKMSLDALKLRFAVPQGDDASFSESDKEVLARLYQSEALYRARIEQTAPAQRSATTLSAKCMPSHGLFTLHPTLTLSTPATLRN